MKLIEYSKRIFYRIFGHKMMQRNKDLYIEKRVIEILSLMSEQEEESYRKFEQELESLGAHDLLKINKSEVNIYKPKK